MCEPVSATTLAAISVGAAAVAGGVSAYGSYQQGRAQVKLARYNEQAARNAARDAQLRGREEETRFRQQLSQFKGSQRAALAGAGVTLDQGSALRIQEDTARFGELDALNVRANTQREQLSFLAQADEQQYRRRQSRMAANLRTAGGLLSTASSVGSGLSQMK